MRIRPLLDRMFSRRATAGRRIKRPRNHVRRLQLATLEDRTVPVAAILNGGGLGYAGNGGGGPPDVTGAAGPNCYIESSNSNLAIYNPKAPGTVLASASPGTFFFTTGGLTQITAGSQRIADVTMLYDDLMGGDGRFLIGNIDISKSANVSQFVFAVSTSNNPTTFSTADWNFYQITTTEGSTWGDYPGNPGFNADAVVITFNMASGNSLTGDSQVLSIDASDLAAGVAQSSLRFYRNDISGDTSFRPTCMHDAAPGDPMWLIHNPDDGDTIDVVRMTNVLSNSASFDTTNLDIPAADDFASGDISPLNPDGTAMDDIDTRILKAGEYNGIIVAAHKVNVGSAADAQWYAFDVNGGTPDFQMIGGVPNVGFIHYGANTYTYEPGIDINSDGTIGLCFMESDTVGGAADPTTGGAPSTFVTARKASDPAGTMQSPVLVSAGTGSGGIGTGSTRIGDFSGLATDPANGTFWAVNQFASGGGGPTDIANFTAALGLDNTRENITIRVDPLDSNMNQVLVTGTDTLVETFTNNSINLYVVVGDANNNAVTIDESFGVVNTPIAFYGGGDVGAPGDRMIVIGTDGDDSLVVTPTAGDTADMSFNGSRLYTFINVRKFAFNGMAGNDEMTVDNSASVLNLAGGIAYDAGGGFDRLNLSQDGGATATADTLAIGATHGSGRSTITAGGNTQVIDFENLEPVTDNVVAVSFSITSMAGLASLLQTDNAITYEASQLLVGGGRVTADAFEPIEFLNKTNLTIDAGAGADTVDLVNSGTPTGLASMTINAGSGDDTVTAPTSAATPGLVVNGGLGNDVLSANGNLNGEGGNDILIGGASGNILNGGDGEDTLDGRGGSNTLNGGANTDAILVSGTAGADTISTTNGAGTFNITGGPSAGNNSISNIEAVRVLAGDGADSITLNLLAAGGLNYTVLGGNPIGTSSGDRLAVNAAAAMTVTPGPENDAGSVDAATGTPTNVSFDEIEQLVIGGGGGGVINGTNGNDAITVIARDASTHAGANGVQDFTAVVNAGLEILFLNQPTLAINALGGSDTIVLRTPAPNNAVWDVDVTVDGGPPSAGDPAGSDRLVVETPGAGAETAVYTPSASDGGTLDLSSLSSLVTILATEELLYDGEADNDSLSVVGTSGSDVITHTPGSTDQAGAFQVNGTLPIAYSNMGSGAALAVNGGAGADTLVYLGTNANDTFQVNAAGDVALNSRLVVATAGIETLTLEGLLGDDLFDIGPPVPSLTFGTVNANGGGQSSATGDQTLLRATAGDDAIGISGQVVTIGGKVVASSGVENISLDAAGGTDTVTYTGVAGTAEAINLISSGVAGQGQVSVPGVALVTFTGLENVQAVGNSGSAGDEDTFAFTGTNAIDLLQINLAAAGTAVDPVLRLLDAAGSTTLLTLLNYLNFNTLRVNGLDGEDIINVYTSALGPSRNLFVDGGAPSGKKKSTDHLTVFYTPPRPKIIQSAETQDPDAGLVDLDYGTARFLVQYDDIEDVVIKRL